MNNQSIEGQDANPTSSNSPFPTKIAIAVLRKTDVSCAPAAAIAANSSSKQQQQQTAANSSNKRSSRE
ncbi:hypothetical protein ACSSS7_005903 [Eimeria intestinalis]